MNEAIEVQEQEIFENDEEMVEAENEEVHEPEYQIVGEPIDLISAENVLKRIEIIQRRRKANEAPLLKYSTDKFVL
ncbi:hypothetical protein Hanom_Chr12g01100641 [Helianthus anomalus]